MIFDIIVMGNDLSSLIAALSAAHHNKKTVLISEVDVASVYSDSGYTFNIDPLPWTGFNPEGIFTKFLSEIGLNLKELANFFPVNTALQVVYPDNRMDVLSNIDAQISEIEREFSVDGTKIRSLFDSIESTSHLISKYVNSNNLINTRSLIDYLKFLLKTPLFLWKKNTLSQEVRSLPSAESLQQMLDAIHFIYSDFGTDKSKPLSYAYSISQSMKGTFQCRGGKHQFIDILKKKFKSEGGQIIENCSVTNMKIKKNIEISLTAKDGIPTICGKEIIISTKLHKFKKLLRSNQVFSRLIKRYSATESFSYFPFTIHVGINETGLPEKMVENVIVVYDEKKPFSNGNLIFIETSTAGDLECATQGKRAMNITIFLSNSPITVKDDDLKKIASRTFDRLENFLPFLRESLDFIDIDKSIKISRMYQEIIGRKLATKSRSVINITNLSNRTPLKNVFITGRYLLPGIGFEGEILSGMNAARLAIKKM